MHELQLSFWRLDGFAAICHQLWLPRWTFVRHVGAGPPWMPTGHSWMLWLQCMQSWHESWDHTLLERMMQSSSNQLHATCGMHTAHHICGVQVRICILPSDMYFLLSSNHMQLSCESVSRVQVGQGTASMLFGTYLGSFFYDRHADHNHRCYGPNCFALPHLIMAAIWHLVQCIRTSGVGGASPRRKIATILDIFLVKQEEQSAEKWCGRATAKAMCGAGSLQGSWQESGSRFTLWNTSWARCFQLVVFWFARNFKQVKTHNPFNRSTQIFCWWKTKTFQGQLFTEVYAGPSSRSFWFACILVTGKFGIPYHQYLWEPLKSLLRIYPWGLYQLRIQ